MKRRRLWYLAIAASAAVAVIWALVPGQGANAQSETCYNLIAGQTATAGQVCVTQTSATSIDVTFTTSGWLMTQAHLAVADSLSGIPQTGSGNPIPGKFQYSTSSATGFTSYTFHVTGLTAGATEYIAAHATVWNKASETTATVVSSTATTVTGSGFTANDGSAYLAYQPVDYPYCSSYSQTATNSVWNTGIGSANASMFQSAGANWIWNLNQIIPTTEQITGQVVYFKQALNVPGLPAGDGHLYIAADNAYRAALDGAQIGQARLGPGFPGTLKEDVGMGPQQGSWGVASQGWQQVGDYTFPVTMGDHTLQITAANEYMSNGSDPSYPADHYLGWNGTSYTSQVFNDPMPNVADNLCYNPGGAIYMAQVQYYAQSETAWAAGTAFPGANWATYFTYTLS